MRALHRVPDEIKAALDATGQPWTAQMGARHLKLFLSGRLVGVLSRGKAGFRTGQSERGTLNVIAQIRRAARGQQ